MKMCSEIKETVREIQGATNLHVYVIYIFETLPFRTEVILVCR